MKRFRDPNLVLSHKRTKEGDSTQQTFVTNHREKKVGDVVVNESLYKAVKSIVGKGFRLEYADKNIFDLLMPTLGEICAKRNYLMPVKTKELPHDLHHCLRPVLMGLSATVRIFFHVFVFGSELYRDGGGVYNRSLQIVSSKPRLGETGDFFSRLEGIISHALIFVVKMEDGSYRLVHKDSQTYFDESVLQSSGESESGSDSDDGGAEEKKEEDADAWKGWWTKQVSSRSGGEYWSNRDGETSVSLWAHPTLGEGWVYLDGNKSIVHLSDPDTIFTTEDEVREYLAKDRTTNVPIQNPLYRLILD